MRLSACPKFPLGGQQNRKHDFDDQLRVRLLFGCLDRSGGAKNVVCRYAAALARKLITANIAKLPELQRKDLVCRCVLRPACCGKNAWVAAESI